MQFKIDENLPIEIGDLFRGYGYDAMTVIEQNLGGSHDEKVALICKSESRTIVTLDNDFADIRTYSRDNRSATAPAGQTPCNRGLQENCAPLFSGASRRVSLDSGGSSNQDKRMNNLPFLTLAEFSR